jgi:hypothetical protein
VAKLKVNVCTGAVVPTLTEPKVNVCALADARAKHKHRNRKVHGARSMGSSNMTDW